MAHATQVGVGRVGVEGIAVATRQNNPPWVQVEFARGEGEEHGHCEQRRLQPRGKKAAENHAGVAQ